MERLEAPLIVVAVPQIANEHETRKSYPSPPGVYVTFTTFDSSANKMCLGFNRANRLQLNFALPHLIDQIYKLLKTKLKFHC